MEVGTKEPRNLSGMTFVDLRDRYGITNIFNMDSDEELCIKARTLGEIRYTN